MVTSTGRPRPNCKSFTFGLAIKASGQMATIRIAAQRSGQVATEINKMWILVSSRGEYRSSSIRILSVESSLATDLQCTADLRLGAQWRGIW